VSRSQRVRGRIAAPGGPGPAPPAAALDRAYDRRLILMGVLDLLPWEAMACRLAGRNLAPAEGAQYSRVGST
jgi:hypothetical protein